MNLYNYSILMFSFCSFTLSLLVWLNRKDEIGKLYFLFTFFITIWGTAFAVTLSNNVSYKVALDYSRYAHAFAVFIPVSWYHFALIYTGYKGNQKFRKLLWIAYGLGIFLCGFAFTPHFISGVSPFPPFEQCAYPGPLYHIFTGTFFILVILAYTFLFKRMNTAVGSEKLQMQGLIYSSLVGFVGGSLTFFTIYRIKFPQYGIFLMPIYPIAVAYFMIKRKLFNAEGVAAAARRDKLAAIGILAASINHEVRSPLYVIRGLAEIVLEKQKRYFGSKEDEPKLAENKDLLDRIMQQSDRAMDIIRRLSTFAKREVDQEFHPGPVNVKEVLENIFPLVRYELESNRIGFANQIDEQTRFVYVDPHYLEEILFNLIVNAAQALKEVSREKKIEVQTLAEGEAVKIILVDNGVGIDPERLPYIFEPFYTTKGEGTGLGLYITQRLVERNGGKISVESKPGVGTKFILQFGTAKPV